MVKRLKLKEKVALIRKLGNQEISSDTIASLQEALGQKSNILVRTAAKVTVDRKILLMKCGDAASRRWLLWDTTKLCMKSLDF